jgi:hypothetical protein
MKAKKKVLRGTKDDKASYVEPVHPKKPNSSSAKGKPQDQGKSKGRKK